MEKRALGKGLEALIPQRDKMKEIFLKEIDAGKDPSSQIINIPVDKIMPNKRQPREKFVAEKLEELVASIKQKGVIQPVLVRKNQDNFELIAGERRLRAAKQLNIKQIPAIIKNVDEKGALELALIENLQREDLNPVEEALAYQRLINEFNFTQDEVAQGVGKARTSVANTLRLLKLPQNIQDAIKNELVSMGHARTLLTVEDPKVQAQLCNLIVAEGLSVREVENLTRGRGQVNLKDLISTRRKRLSGKHARIKDMHIVAVEEELQQILGTRVNIVHSKKRGKLQIEYYSLQDLDRLLALIRKIRNS